MQLSREEKAFVLWALEYLVSHNSVNINPEGRFFFRKKFFEEMQAQEEYLSHTGRMQFHQIKKKVIC